ncbi:chaperone protein dnaJ 11, chloroplastic-like [Cynara cardunculus var. scolymus]|uniref:DnaJ domain-containing protein n=1 Tax=Cynara cardunculus var. scolymus TaxID=59895 RepID=A0A118K686_CYNCS|nr:chaperone protein dnaJ 11, chloroplastic-like [Cynara cardunculus var. scolymus]KVI10303.1 DnaJ domain-containing protein [Cynara cardunculus var. scolymus]
MIAGISPLRLPPPNSNGSTSFHAVLKAKPVVEQAFRRRSENLYEVLRIGRNATTTEIKTAYRSLAKVYHPDALEFTSHGGDCDFIEIHKAYATLSDPEARAMYDLKWRRRSGMYSVVGKRPGFYAGGRRWETDQCW